MMKMTMKPAILRQKSNKMLCAPPLSTRVKPKKQKQRASAGGTQQFLPLPTISTELQEEQEKQKSSHNFQERGIIKIKSMRKLSDAWGEVQGSNNWDGVLDPMDPLLRSELIKYGEFAQACYDAFDSDPYSSYCGTCKYNPLSPSHSAYRITKYLYVTSNINVPNFFKKSRIGHKIDKLPWSYSHVGVELELDHTKSPFLRPTVDPSCSHNLEAYLHLLDVYHGSGERFYLANGRDPALVNKASDFHIPPFWKQDHNKGMAKNSDGRL